MEFPAGPMADIPLKGMPMPMLGATIGTPMAGMLIPGWTIPRPGIGPSIGLGGTGLVRSWLRPSEEGWGEIEAMGVTPNGFEDEGGVGDTPRLDMVLPGVTAMPATGDGPENKHKDEKVKHGSMNTKARLLNTGAAGQLQAKLFHLLLLNKSNSKTY